MNEEQERLKHKEWKKWGPYVSNRQWATVREDYSDYGSTWDYTNYNSARSKTYRWGEDGIGGISDDKQLLCFAPSLWNRKDPFIKERLFGLTNWEGNHGEDVKEQYYYLDNTPTHSYMKMLYKYPHEEFPYKKLVNENKKRSRQEPEYELLDTGIFKDKKYFDVSIEYAKNGPEDIFVRIIVYNRGEETAPLHLLPTIWFRNTWSWGDDPYKPTLEGDGSQKIKVIHEKLPPMALYCENNALPLFCENETNIALLYNKKRRGFYKDGINDYITRNDDKAINKMDTGTKAAFNIRLSVEGESSAIITLRLGPDGIQKPFENCHALFKQRIEEANLFYENLQKDTNERDARHVQRQALAGMLWNKQFYYYDVDVWINGDPSVAASPSRKTGRNHRWMHLHNADVISMPDKWEYPWYAAWDLAFHCIPLALTDIGFAKQQLLLLTKERYMHPNGQLPAYEWDFGDVNPPVHAWAAWKVYNMGKKQEGKGDLSFLESIFHKLLMNFTWWVNRKDTAGNNIFQGGFLGLDNIGVFDRNSQLPAGGYIEQADGTSWMAMFSLNMLRISLELAGNNPVYQDMATKFFEHFLYIAGAMAHMGEGRTGLWDEQDGFFYDQVRLPENGTIQLKVRSMVGLIPLFAVEVLDNKVLLQNADFLDRMNWFLDNRPDLAALVTRWQQTNEEGKHLLSLLRTNEIQRIMHRMLDETEFLSDYGIRSLSKYHEQNPYELQMEGNNFQIAYDPGESINDMFGGNSNWRGPVWMPLNYMIIESLRKYHYYYGDNLKVECPVGSGRYLNLNEVAGELTARLTRLFLLNKEGKRVAAGDDALLHSDPDFRDNLQFYEYFHGDTGRGLGASQQTGWTGLIAELIRRL
ncbi:MAG: glucosidase [Chitinophagaceae bacterium]|nr:glucosidase [Chitinophagaceae bacterium]